ncbi:hypothetical protein MRS76_11345 [Rhizobiaceae bacterium n13]|uniref:hypothetical protein n=1 Tax=Ferirhizobium litorale TaxID=2927786 RepID=UPI0024B29887|nr:hypothetical protein [Fererhizobium litorale]MDI7862556.1 hypothetical protein [Fererhizobium litorale]
MIQYVSFHAVVRYLDRVLGLPVDEWLAGLDHLPEDKRAQKACECAGLPVDAVRLCMLTEPVIRALRRPLSTKVHVITPEAIFIVQDGTLVTVLSPQMQRYRTKKYKAHKSNQLREV